MVSEGQFSDNNWALKIITIMSLVALISCLKASSQNDPHFLRGVKKWKIEHILLARRLHRCCAGGLISRSAGVFSGYRIYNILSLSSETALKMYA